MSVLELLDTITGAYNNWVDVNYVNYGDSALN